MILSLYKRFGYYTFYIPSCEYLKVKKYIKILTNKMFRITMGIHIPKHYRKIRKFKVFTMTKVFRLLDSH